MVLPLLVFVTGRRFPIAISAIALAQLFVPRLNGSFLWYVRTDAIALGVMLAMFSRNPTYKLIEPTTFQSRWRSTIAFVGLLSLLITLPTRSDVLPFSTGMIAIVSAVLVFVASYDRDYLIGGLLKVPFLWIGSRSFAIYLIHWPAIAVTRAIWKFIEPTGTTFGASYSFRFVATWLTITLVAAELNYRFVEIPLRSKGRDVARRIETEPLDEQEAHEPDRRPRALRA